jgi:hypothetical protein
VQIIKLNISDAVSIARLDGEGSSDALALGLRQIRIGGIA